MFVWGKLIDNTKLYIYEWLYVYINVHINYGIYVSLIATIQ